MQKFYMLFLSMVFSLGLSAQQCTLLGKAVDEFGHPISGVNITLDNPFLETISDKHGQFRFTLLATNAYHMSCFSTGYEPVKKQFRLGEKDTLIIITFKRAFHQLEEVLVEEDISKRRTQEESMNLETVKRAFILKNLGGSLMKSLERIPGIKTIGIGSGQSKPLIRGMGFNRVLVVDKGIKHEGQQWGADHGLELDQYSAREVEIIKGAASFIYGSDAIAGVIELKPPLIPAAHSINGSVDLTAKSNNSFYGSSVNLYGRDEHWFFDTRLTYQNYGDYQVPTDAVYVYDYKVPLEHGFLRNTAGKETDLHLTVGYLKNHLRSVASASNIQSRSGFFANAHGLEPRRVETELHDASSRDILMPNQQVNHFKLINRTDFELKNHALKFDIGFQRNFRQEFSPYVNHGYMPPIYPANRSKSAQLEREFDKSVYSANFKDQITWGSHKLSLGLNAEHQTNAISGWSFLVPSFTQTTAGGYLYDQYSLSQNALLHGAIRYDFGRINMKRYDDWFTTPFGTGSDQHQQYLTRAGQQQRTFNSLVYSMGMNFNANKYTLKWNAGKSFRMPIAKELGANGVNYHYFSYEKGDPSLAPETSYQLDLGIGFKDRKWSVNFSPFYNHFPNYIYLNPTADHDFDYGAGNQVFKYAQSKVMRYGAELQIRLDLFKGLSGEILAEYLHTKQLSGDKKGYALPFTPPQSVLFNLSYSPEISYLKDAYLSVDYRITASQNNIVPPERKTEGYHLINLQVGSKLSIASRLCSINLQAQNLLNKKYLNHTSFYRLISLPEAGRNLILSLNIPLKTK